MSVLGMVEYTTIAAGIRASDAMVKAAPVDLIESRPITPGKYMSLVNRRSRGRRGGRARRRRKGRP